MNKVHEFVIKLWFDKPVYKRNALYQAKQHIFGENYLYDPEGGAEIMRVRTIKPKKRYPSDELDKYKLNFMTNIRALGVTRLYKDQDTYIVRHRSGFLILNDHERQNLIEMLSNPTKLTGGQDD